MTSSSTLARRARAEKNPRKAKALRAKANQARRDERELAKKPYPDRMTGLPEREQIIKRVNKAIKAIETGQHSGIVVGLNPVFMGSDEAANDSNAARAASPDAMPLMQKPWYEEENEIARLAAIAKKPEQFKAQFLGMVASSRFDGRTKALMECDGQAAEINKQWAINFVSGFLARMNAEAKANGGPLPRAVVVDGVTMARVVDALEKAGYTADGVTGLRRAVG